MGGRSIGFYLIIAGVVLVLAGVLATTGALSWFGRLPGDIRIEREHSRLYIPLTSMLLLSALFSLVAYLIRRFFF